MAAKLDELHRSGADKDRVSQAVLRGLDAQSDAVRWRAARLAGRLGLDDAAVLGKLQQAAADDNWIVQLHAIAALGQSGDKSDATVDALTKAAVSSNDRVAAAAISSLRKLQVDPEKLASTLNQVLADENAAVAVYAVEAMVEAGGKAVPMLKASLKQPNAAFWACLAIADIGPDAAGTVPELIDFLNNHDKVEAIPQAMLALAAIGLAASSAESAITDALERWNDDQSVQLSGMYALGSIGASDSLSLLQQRADGDDPFQAMVASWALAKTHPDDQQMTETAVERLVAGLGSSNTNMSRAAAHGLASLELPEGTAAPHLIEAANDPEAREHMVAALASLGDKVVPHAKQALAKPETRELAIAVLDRLGEQASGATDALVETLDESEPEVAVQIHNTLAKFGPAASQAADKLAGQLDSSDPKVRQSAMYALREIGPGASSAKDALLSVLQQDDSSTPEGKFEQVAAAWTLASIAGGDPQVAEVVLPVIRQGLDSPSELLRRESIAATVDLGDAGKPLHETIAEMAESDPSGQVREDAAVATASPE